MFLLDFGFDTATCAVQAATIACNAATRVCRILLIGLKSDTSVGLPPRADVSTVIIVKTAPKGL